MGRRAGLSLFVALVAFAPSACNALTGASDLSFDETPVVEPGDDAATLADTSTAFDSGKPSMPMSDGGPEASVDASPCNGTSAIESVTSSPTMAMNGTQVGSIPWNVNQAPNTVRVSLNGNQISNYVIATGFAFDSTIPPSAVIKGFQVTITRSADFPDEVADYGVALVKAGAPGAPKTVAGNWPTVATAVTYGSSSDLWASTWMPADVQTSKFGVAIAARGVDAAMTTAKLTNLTVKVFFARCP